MKSQKKIIEVSAIIVAFLIMAMMAYICEIKNYSGSVLLWFFNIIIQYTQIFIVACYLNQKNKKESSKREYKLLEKKYKKYVFLFFFPLSVIFFVFGFLQISGRFENPFFMFYIHRYYQDFNVVIAWIIILLWSIYYSWWLFFCQGLDSFKNLAYIHQLYLKDNGNQNQTKENIDDRETIIWSLGILFAPFLLVITFFCIDWFSPYFQNLLK